MTLTWVIVIDLVAVAGTVILATLVAQRFRWLPERVIEFFIGTGKEHDAVPWILGAVVGLVVELVRILIVMQLVQATRDETLAWWTGYRFVGVPILVGVGFLTGSMVGDQSKKARETEGGVG